LKNLSILTSSEEFSEAAVQEARQADPKVRLERTLTPGVSLISSSMDFENLAGVLSLLEPVFVRHICPVYGTIPLENSLADLPKLAQAISQLPKISEHLDEGTPFSVQVRFVDDNPNRAYSAFAVKEEVAGMVIGQTAAIENVKSPEIVISAVIGDREAFYGVSYVEENLSSWAGGMRRYARDDGQVSRAEFKILEALEIFGLTLPESGTALDLGAAPGGWSRVLLAAGLHVIAVDPAELDPRLLENPNIEHYHGHADEYLRIALLQKREFEIIVSDLRMDAWLAAEVMGRARNLLVPNGFAFTTLKLPHAAPRQDPVLIMKRALDTLRRFYPTVRAKQLFHNRQEVMVLLKS
jgi:23S rRNA (cytidine2498-2'-O)-methyltransferase